jgi:hypothetical protein
MPVTGAVLNTVLARLARGLDGLPPRKGASIPLGPFEGFIGSEFAALAGGGMAAKGDVEAVGSFSL